MNINNHKVKLYDEYYTTRHINYNKNIIHAKLRNQQRELTPFLSGERFVYIKAELTRALPSVVNINHNKCRIFHPSLENSCSRCRYTGHCRQNTEICNAYTDNSDIISIRSQNNVMSNFYQSVVTLDWIDFNSSEYAYQWRLVKILVEMIWSKIFKELLLQDGQSR